MGETREQKLERLKRQRDQLNARIQRESAREQQRQRKERNNRLMRWGIVIERLIESGEMPPEKWAELCDRHLTRDTDRRRAFTGPLEGLDPAGGQNRADPSEQGRDPTGSPEPGSADAGQDRG